MVTVAQAMLSELFLSSLRLCWFYRLDKIWGLTDHELQMVPMVHPSKVKVKVRVTLRLAVYRQSVGLGVTPLETHDQIFFQLNSCGNSP
jgi:hypothetical protein